MRRDYDVEHIWVLSNMVDSLPHGKQLFEKLNRVAEQFLGRGVNYLDAIPLDRRIKEANKAQKAVLDMSPSSLSGIAYQRVAEQLEKLPKPKAARGQLEFFC
jgi:flagellar biosynthesis protein FlhG